VGPAGRQSSPSEPTQSDRVVGVGGGLLARLVEPAPEITGTIERPRARVLISLALALATLLTVSALVSTLTTAIARHASSTLGPYATAGVAAAAVGFWIAYVLSRGKAYRRGAWFLIITIYAFLTAFSIFRGGGTSLMAGLAVPALVSTIFLNLRGTLWMALGSLVLGAAYLPIITLGKDPQPAISWIYGMSMLAAILGLTLLLSLMREDDVTQLDRLRTHEAQEGERLRAEAELVRSLQRAMVQSDLPDLPGIDLAVHFEPAREASGDFYDLFLVDDASGRTEHLLVVALCDVAGKGMASALVGAAARSALRGEAERGSPPGEVLFKVNRLLVETVPSRLFVTAFLGILDVNSGHLRYASAGHPHPYRWSPGNGSPGSGCLDTLRSDGLPLGITADALYVEESVDLHPDDFLLAYTDGLVEALAPSREIYGFERLDQTVAEAVAMVATTRGRLERVIAQVDGFVAGSPASDDVTVVALGCIPVPGR
jgi:serine phosphatase RsbU (regulator of sigma subunit)